MDTNEARVLNLDALLAQQRMLLQHCVNKAVNTGSNFSYDYTRDSRIINGNSLMCIWWLFCQKINTYDNNRRWFLFTNKINEK